MLMISEYGNLNLLEKNDHENKENVDESSENMFDKLN